MVLASEGKPFSRPAIDQAARLADGSPVAVVSVARMYGSAYGLPNPGLMPTRSELAAQQDQVNRALRILGRRGLECYGQVAIARRATKAIAKAAAARGADHIVIDVRAGPRWRQVVEGDLVKELQRKCGRGIEIHPVRVAGS